MSYVGILEWSPQWRRHQRRMAAGEVRHRDLWKQIPREQERSGDSLLIRRVPFGDGRGCGGGPLGGAEKRITPEQWHSCANAHVCLSSTFCMAKFVCGRTILNGKNKRKLGVSEFLGRKKETDPSANERRVGG